MTDGNAAEGTVPTGTGAPAGVKGAMAEFVGELTRFRETIETKLQAQENRMTMLDRKTAIRGRAPLSSAAETEAPHQKAFAAYLRQGDDAALRGLVLEEKGITVATDGGFLAAPQISADVQDALRNGGSLRAISTVVQVDSPSYEVLIDRADLGSGWSGEGAVAETDAPRVDRVSIPLHELSAMPKVSQRLLDDAAFDKAVDLLLAAGVPAAPAYDARLTSQHPQFVARGYYEDLDHPIIGVQAHPSLPFRYASVDRWLRTSSPMLGQHNHEILTDLGLSAEEIAALEADHQIGTIPLGL